MPSFGRSDSNCRRVATGVDSYDEQLKLGMGKPSSASHMICGSGRVEPTIARQSDTSGIGSRAIVAAILFASKGKT